MNKEVERPSNMNDNTNFTQADYQSIRNEQAGYNPLDDYNQCNDNTFNSQSMHHDGDMDH